MSKQLEEIFSTDRLRKTWAGKPQPYLEGPDTSRPMAGDRPPSTPPRPLVIFAELMVLVRRRFSEENGKLFEPLLTELEAKLKSRFPDDPRQIPPEKERDTLNSDIDALFNQMEDLAEALDLTEKR